MRDLSHDTSGGFFTAGIQTRATLKARASRPDDTFEQVYRSEKEERVLFVPTEASGAAQINHVLSG